MKLSIVFVAAVLSLAIDPWRCQCDLPIPKMSRRRQLVREAGGRG